MGVGAYNTNPALNTSISGVDISEGCNASWFNDALRQMMADIAVWTASNGVSYPVSIGNGGTGQTTAAAALTALGGLSATYQHLPQSAKSSGFTFDLTQDAGHVLYSGSAATATVPTNAGVAFPIGTAIVVVNNGSGALAIARAGGVSMKWASTGADADRSLAIGGMATLLKVGTDLWFISGAGLT